jgi:hypothetical protein
VTTLNVNSVVAAVVGARDATLYELQTVYGLEDLWNLFEIRAVAQHNEYLAAKRAAKGR